MIVGSLLLILVAVGLLVAGVLSGSNALIICCIIVVVLAAIVLVLGVKQSAAAGALDPEDVDAGAEAGDMTGEYPAVRRGGSSRSDSGFPVRQSSRRRNAELIDEQEMADVAASGTSRRDARGAASGGTGSVVEQGIPSQSADRYADAPTYESFEAPEYETTTFDAPVTEAPDQTDQPYEAGSYASSAYGGSGYGNVGYGNVGYEGSGYEGYAEPSYETQSSYETQAAEAEGQDFDEPVAYEQSGGAAFEEDPPDEPSAQVVTPGNAARVAMLTTDVLVVDGRPRYHVPGCVHLHNKESEPIPVGEAVELGFTPCALCEPDSALLADARRV